MLYNVTLLRMKMIFHLLLLVCLVFFDNIDIPWLFVCLGFFFTLEIFSLIWKRHWLQILPYAWHSVLLSSEGPFAFHIYCYTGHPFIIVISYIVRPVTLTPIAERVAMVLSPPVFTRSVAAGIRTPNLSLAGRTIKPTAPPPLVYPLNEK